MEQNTSSHIRQGHKGHDHQRSDHATLAPRLEYERIGVGVFAPATRSDISTGMICPLNEGMYDR